MYIFLFAFLLVYTLYYKNILAHKVIRNMQLRLLRSSIYRKYRKNINNTIKESSVSQIYNMLQIRYAEIFTQYYELPTEHRCLIENCKDLII